MQNIIIHIVTFVIVMKNVESKPPLRIIGGKDAGKHEYPYVVRIEIRLPKNNEGISNTVHICTGAIVASSWTLTAAHCFNTYEKYNADNQLTLLIKYEAVFEPDACSVIDHYIKHHAYKSSRIDSLSNTKSSNDLALAHHQPITMKQYGKLSSLDYATLTGHEVTLAGYGLTNHTDGKLYDTLELKKSLQLLPGAVVKCQDALLYPALCVSRRCEKSGTAAEGDSGGPVIHLSGIVGIITKGYNVKGILENDLPVYTSAFITPLSPYLEWISGHIRQSC